MTVRKIGAVLVLTAALALAGCGAGGGGGGLPPASQEVGHTDINPQPRDNVRDGGDLRLPIDSLPNNYNYNQVDGTLADVSSIIGGLMPTLFKGTADGGVALNTDYLTSAELTSTSPQVVTYTINPKAVWSDGSPLTWRDFEALWRAQNGTDPAYLVSGTTGYSDIASVAPGTDDRQAVVTFARPYAEWKGLFNPFYPASKIGTAAGFNTAYRTGFPLTSGPFTLDAIDQTAKTITLKRDPRWWGTPPKLDRVIYKALDRSAQPDALANNEIDYFEIGSAIDLLRRAQSTPGVVVRNAPSRYFNHITLNGAAGAILSDEKVRRAVVQGIDRAEITRRMIGQIVPDAQPDGNHLYVPGTKDYRDNAGALPFDPAAAEKALDEAGWARPAPGQPRAKDGRPLSVRMVYYNAQSNLDIVKTVQNQLAAIGVTVVPEAYPGNEFDTASTQGNFDLIVFAWGGTATPLSSAVGIYSSPLGDSVRQNYGRVADPRIDELFTRGIAELDDAKRVDIGNEIDRLIWQEAHSVVLYARPGAVGVRSNLANFGAPGFADPDYVDAGFVK